MLPTIALVIPSFNRASLIVETIQSALDQTCPFAEIIVVDDASSDNTLTVLKQFGKRITIIALNKSGVQTARNAGVQAASSTYVALCDSDDLLSKDYVTILTSWFAKDGACDGVYSNFVTFNETGVSKDKFSQAPDGFFAGAKQDGNFFTAIPGLYHKTVSFQPLFSSGNVFKRDFYQTLGGYNTMFDGVGSEDWEFTLRALATGNIALCSTPIVRIRRHSGNDSKNSLHMLLGEITVLEHANAHHYVPDPTKVIAEGLNRRRIAAFNLAFGRHEYATAASLLTSITNPPSEVKFRVKRFLLTVTKFFLPSLWAPRRRIARVP